MISIFGQTMAEMLVYLIGTPFNDFTVIDIPFISGIVFLVVFICDLLHLIGVVLHG